METLLTGSVWWKQIVDCFVDLFSTCVANTEPSAIPE